MKFEEPREVNGTMKTISQLPMAITTLCAALLLLMLPSQARAQATANPPNKVGYQGFLTDDNGVPLGNNAPLNETLVLRIFNAATGGTLKWAERQTVTVDKGHFSVLLGEGSQNNSEPFTADIISIFTGADASERFVEITLGAITILPRVKFFAVPYSMLAMNARQLLDENGIPFLKSPAGKVDITGGAIVSGDVTASGFLGSGEGLTDLNASALASGTVPDARLNANILDAVSAAYAFKALKYAAFGTLKVVGKIVAASTETKTDILTSRLGINDPSENTNPGLHVFSGGMGVSILKKSVRVFQKEGYSWGAWSQGLTTDVALTDGYINILVGIEGSNNNLLDSLLVTIFVDGIPLGRAFADQGSHGPYWINNINQEGSAMCMVPKGSRWSIEVQTQGAGNYYTGMFTYPYHRINCYWTALGK